MRIATSCDVSDALSEGIGADGRTKLTLQGAALGQRVDESAALGALVLVIGERLEELGNLPEISGEKAFEGVGKKATAEGVKLYLEHWRKDLDQAGKLVDELIK